MLSVEDVVPRLLSAASSIGPNWESHLDEWDNDTGGHFNDIAVVARHLVASLAADKRDEVAAIFLSVEEMLREDVSTEARDLLVVGLLEDVQNITSHEHAPVGSSEFTPFLGPFTMLAWIELHSHWGSGDT